jgi:putative tryptophan/tyrosine transport system permease protein
MSSVIFDTAFQQGFLYVLAVFGIVISFRMMNFPDLTVDGSFTLGAAVLAILLSNGYSIFISILLAILAGFIAGVATALLNRKLGISKILSGILIMLILYSIKLRVMGKANISLLRIDTIFTPFESLDNVILLLFLFGIAVVVLFILLYFSITKLGLFIRATGDNEFMVRSQGVNTDWVFIIGIGISNALIAFSGAMVAQSQGFADVSMGIGMIITALAALIIGESFISVIQSLKRKIFKKNNEQKKSHLPWDIFNEFFAAILGAFLYFLIIAISLQLGLAPTDLKLATGILVIIGIALRFKKTTSETYQKAKL